VVTTIRLENLFWDVLAEIAGREDKTTNQMIATLYEELTALREDNPNFTSFLRVCCLRYLSLPRVDESAQKLAILRTSLVPARPAALTSLKTPGGPACLACTRTHVAGATRPRESSPLNSPHGNTLSGTPRPGFIWR
jgi:predicted DNA-binding ribbon-helix-helix protein